MRAPDTELIKLAIERFSDVAEDERITGNLIRRITIRLESDCYDGCAFDMETCQRGLGGYHGIAGREITWSVAVAGVGAVGLTLLTPIYSESVLLRSVDVIARWRPLGSVDLHHGTRPEFWSIAWSPHEPCRLIDAPCWCDFTYLAADDGFDQFIKGGTPAVFAWLGEKWLPEVIK